MPHVIEPAAGATRAAMAFLMAAYHTETVGDSRAHVVLRLDHRLAPYKVAVLPLSQQGRARAATAHRGVRRGQGAAGAADYDQTQSIGKPLPPARTRSARHCA